MVDENGAWPRNAGAGRAAVGSVHRPPVRVSGPHPGQPDQYHLLGRHRVLPVSNGRSEISSRGSSLSASGIFESDC